MRSKTAMSNINAMLCVRFCQWYFDNGPCCASFQVLNLLFLVWQIVQLAKAANLVNIYVARAVPIDGKESFSDAAVTFLQPLLERVK